MSSKYVFFFLTILISSTKIYAQLNASTIGYATENGSNCYTITPGLKDQSGGVWYNNPINFDSDFTINYDNYFGNKNDDGADGMALVFKTNSTPQIGLPGGGLGYETIKPSLAIEFDTWKNDDRLDQNQDHIAIMANGDSFHNTTNNLAGPVQASSTSSNIEDGITHNIKITWNATTKELKVYFDCVLRLSLTNDIKTAIFSGDDTVYFGFVGSTGYYSNLQTVCFNSISFLNNNIQLPEETICSGSSINIDASITKGMSYSWTPNIEISNPNISNPVFSPTTTRTYTVQIIDSCGDTTFKEVTINVVNTTTPTFNSTYTICEGDPSPLPNQSNDATPITGNWNKPFDNVNDGTYTFIPNNPLQCANTVSVNVIVTPKVIPTLDPVYTICEGESSPLANQSNDTTPILGNWSPAVFDNKKSASYTFIATDPTICAEPVTVNVIVNPTVTPIFDSTYTICKGDSNPLPNQSNNPTPITGNWNKPFDNVNSDTYTFIPNNPSQCAQTVNVNVIVKPIVTPTFNPIYTFCEGNTSPLPNQSNDATPITGNWDKPFDNVNDGTYTFIPNNPSQCAESVSVNVIVIPKITPTFDATYTICEGIPSSLPNQSNDVIPITGNWSPAVVDNKKSATYTFTATDPSICAEPVSVNVVVLPMPKFNIDDEYAFCKDSSGAIINPAIIDTGLTSSEYYFEWHRNGLLLTDENEGILTTTQVGIYEVFVSLLNMGAPMCQITDWTEVKSALEIELTATLLTEPFEDNQVIQAKVIGGSSSSIYEYRIDNSPWQDNPIFTNVSPGTHTIEVNDTFGCGSDTFPITVIGYPKYFTPNNDNYNDFWNIAYDSVLATAKIFIYDKYGKLITSINPNGIGWNGTYNGNPLPSNDYWFVLEYDNYYTGAGERKQFRSHFTLKR